MNLESPQNARKRPLPFLTVNRALWLVYGLLLGVLLPHTAWAFSMFEPGDKPGVTAWMAAIAFEATIAAFTHKEASHLSTVPKRVKGWKGFSERYLNSYTLGLVIAIIVSGLANFGHAVEYSKAIKVNTGSPVLFGVYVFAFGAVLPFASLLFASVLSEVAEEEAANPELEKANDKIRSLSASIRAANREAAEAERRLAETEQRLAGVEHLAVMLFAEDIPQRIAAVHETWPELPQRSVAIIAGASASYTNETLKKLDLGD